MRTEPYTRQEFDALGRRSFKTCDREVAKFLEKLAKSYDNAERRDGRSPSLGFLAWPKRD